LYQSIFHSKTQVPFSVPRSFFKLFFVHQVISAARVRIHPQKAFFAQTENGPVAQTQPLYAGQPIPATLSVSTSFHWGGPGSQAMNEKNYGMRFDIREDPKDWLISGRKKGDFRAMVSIPDVSCLACTQRLVHQDGSVYSMPLTLIPLHHGELRLPEVHVYPLPLTSGEMTMGSMALPSAEVYQVHGAEKVLIMPRGGRSTFVVGMGS